MLTTVYQVDGFGMQYYPAVLNNEVVVLGVGARYVAVYDTQLSIKKRCVTALCVCKIIMCLCELCSLVQSRGISPTTLNSHCLHCD